MLTEQEKFMKEAIRQAKKARALEEVPIGCKSSTITTRFPYRSFDII